VDALRQQCRRLASLPGTLGHPRPELRPDIRSFAFKNYVIFFRYEGDTLEVVNILEGVAGRIPHSGHSVFCIELKRDGGQASCSAMHGCSRVVAVLLRGLR
jgi:hypothetical protein